MCRYDCVRGVVRQYVHTHVVTRSIADFYTFSALAGNNEQLPQFHTIERMNVCTALLFKYNSYWLIWERDLIHFINNLIH